jgi:phenylalanyl-tRNA synthetase alpha chain
VNAAEAQALLDAASTDAAAAVVAAESVAALDDIAREYVGKKSRATVVNEGIKSLDAAERPVVGEALRAYREQVSGLINDKRSSLQAGERAALAESERLDLTLGTHGYRRGHLHLVTQIRRELEDIFVGLGYQIAEGPEVEDDWHNFEALNIPAAHPARSMQDTLFVDLGEPEQVLLRTHTSPMQVRMMEAGPPPLYVVSPGKVFRNETSDARHSPVFHQLEGFAVDKGITMADLFGTIEAFAKRLFDDESVTTRFRSDFFPYTEPSAELAVSCVFCHQAGCRVCSHTGWIELGGCGMIDPNVFHAVGYDPEQWQGFAFGFGLERIAMVRYAVDEIRTFFESDTRFLEQY